MLLFLMRHGIAAEIGDAAPDDFSRALTDRGRARAQSAARGLHFLVPKLDLIATSPKVRARETAQIARKVWRHKASLELWSELLGDDFAVLSEKLRLSGAQTALLCGHEPHLSRLVAQFLTGSPHAFTLQFKKAGVCALEVDFEASLLWHLTPKQLRRLG